MQELVKSGRYASASEVVRDSLRMLEEREEQRAAKLSALREEIRKGVVSGDGLPAASVLNRLEAKYRR
ncbi:type II toxin-antitoxin system ParD family antitoxin [Rhizobium sp. T136]|uniref:type II toxin-antitoxin system ParD family antitoxin n=1 Tax=Rhizobium sp. T136 TaxID=555319 RepID=UPI0004153A7F